MHKAKVVLEDGAYPELKIDCQDPSHSDMRACPLQEAFRYDGWDAFKLDDKYGVNGVEVEGEFPVHYWLDVDEGWIVYGEAS